MVGSKNKWIVIGIAVISVIVIGIVIYACTETTGGLSEAQISNLETELLKEYRTEDFEEYNFRGTQQLDLNVFGTEKIDGGLRLYGYESFGYFIDFRGKAYEESGGRGPVVCDIEIDGDDVTVIKRYGEGVTEDVEKEMMPFLAKVRMRDIDTDDERRDSGLYEKVENELGVPVEKEYTLSIEGDKYEIYDWDTDLVIIDEGELTEEEKN